MVATDRQQQQTDYRQLLSHSPWRKIRQGQKLQAHGSQVRWKVDDVTSPICNGGGLDYTELEPIGRSGAGQEQCPWKVRKIKSRMQPIHALLQVSETQEKAWVSITDRHKRWQPLEATVLYKRLAGSPRLWRTADPKGGGSSGRKLKTTRLTRTESENNRQRISAGAAAPGLYGTQEVVWRGGPRTPAGNHLIIKKNHSPGNVEIW